MRVEKKVFVHECDGCGYQLNPADMMELKLIVEPRKGSKHSIPFHFHPLTPEHDCLRYWFNGSHVMEFSLKKRDMISDEVKELILKTTKYRSAA